MKKLLALSMLFLTSSAFAEDVKPAKEYFLGNLEIIKGGDVAVASLLEEKSDEDKDEGKEKKRKKNEKAANFAFIRLDSGEVKWLAPNNSQKFLFRKEVKDKDTAPEGEGKKKGSAAKVRANVYAVVSADTDKDGNLSEKDKINIGISGPAGGGYRVLVTDIDELFDVDSSDEGRVAVIYRKGGKLSRAVIDVDGFKVISEGALPEIK